MFFKYLKKSNEDPVFSEYVYAEAQSQEDLNKVISHYNNLGFLETTRDEYEQHPIIIEKKMI